MNVYFGEFYNIIGLIFIMIVNGVVLIIVVGWFFFFGVEFIVI